MGVFHISPEAFGGIFAALSVGMIGGGQVNILLSRWFSSEQIFKTALRAQVMIALIFLLGSFFNWYGFTAHVVILFIYISCVGLTNPNAASLALAPFEKNAGSAAALLGFLQMGIGALASAAYGLLNFGPGLTLAILFASTSLLGLWVSLRAPKQIQIQNNL
jgi:DHA1 family bicyclomycin/chloramphenicol resistance-like MFS transporter